MPIQGAHQQSTPVPRLPQAVDPIAVLSSATAVAPAQRLTPPVIEAARVALPPLPPRQRPTPPTTQAVRDASPPAPSPQRPTPSPSQAVRDESPLPPSLQQPALAPRPTETPTNAATAVHPPKQQVSPLPTLAARCAQLVSPSLPYTTCLW